MDHIEKINQAGTQFESSKNRNPAIEKGLIKSVCLNCGRQYKKQTEICQKCLFKTKSI